MNIMICGATGLIGSALVNKLGQHHRLALVGRRVTKLMRRFGQTHALLEWPMLNVQNIAHQDVIINLSGASISALRWTKRKKEQLFKSRVETTRQLALLCAQLGPSAPKLINASAMSAYGCFEQPDQWEQVFDEASKPMQGQHSVLAQIAHAWEAALQPAIDAQCKTAVMRISLVLTPTGGVLKQLLPSFRLGCGVIQGSGQQPFSWVSLDDAIRAFSFLAETPEATGTFNLVAQDVPTQEEFAKALAKSLNRPCVLKLPAWLIKCALGEMGRELLLSGVHMRSTRLQSMNFEYTHPTLNDFLQCLSGH